jgi:hypothetical protein
LTTLRTLCLLAGLGITLSLLLIALLSALRTLSLLSSLRIPLRLIAGLLPVRVAIAAGAVLIQPAAQRIEVICELPRAIQSFFRARSSGATRTLLRRLQSFREVVQTSLDRTFVCACRVELIVVESLLSFSYAVGNAITRKRPGRFVQLTRNALLTRAQPLS